MRVLQAVSLAAAAAILTGSAATAQGLADAAAREREKRKGKAGGSAKVITEEELRKAGGSVSSPAASDGGTVTGAPATGTTPGSGAAADAAAKAPGKAAGDEKSEEQIKAEQAAAWRQKLELAQKQVGVYQDLIKALQADLNDMSGGVYTPRRASAQANLEKTQKELAAAQQTVADLEAEGRRNGYR